MDRDAFPPVPRADMDMDPTVPQQDSSSPAVSIVSMSNVNSSSGIIREWIGGTEGALPWPTAALVAAESFTPPTEFIDEDRFRI
jgi:hypothetical protein